MSRGSQADFGPQTEADLYSIGVDPAVRLQTVDAADLLSREPKPPKFVIRHLVPESGLVLLSGDTGSCKTAFLVHLAVNVANRAPVAGLFDVTSTAGPVLYLNGEMSNDVMQRYVLEAVAANGGTLPRGRFQFEGSDGEPFATFRFNERPEEREAMEGLVDRLRPSVIIIDTQRAIFEFDENDAGAVRSAYNWLRSLCQRFGCSVILAHHLRKITNQGSNSARERVSGSRDLIAGVDVHLAVKSTNGGPMTSVVLDKTRTPADGVMQGTVWPMTVQLDQSSSPYRSIIVAGAAGLNTDAQAANEREDELIAQIEAEAPVTIQQLGARDGAKKRAFDSLRRAGTVVAVGKHERKTLFGLAGVEYALLTPNGVTAMPLADPTRDPVRRKPNNHAGLNGVTTDQVRRPRTGAKADPGPETIVPPDSGDDVSEPIDPVTKRVGSLGSHIYRDPVRDPTRQRGVAAAAIVANAPPVDDASAFDDIGRAL